MYFEMMLPTGIWYKAYEYERFNVYYIFIFVDSYKLVHVLFFSNGIGYFYYFGHGIIIAMFSVTSFH